MRPGDTPMRILQILHNRKFGGAEQHLVQLCEGLRAAGHQVEAAVPRGSWVWQRLEEAGFVLHDFDFRAHYDLPALLRLWRLIRRGRFDLVHTHLVRAAFYGRVACRIGGTPLVSSVHDLLTWKNYPRAGQLIAVSEAVRGNLVARGFEAGRIKVVFPGARDCSLGAARDRLRAETRLALGLAPDELALFMVGRVAQVKGHDVALDAFGRLQGRTARPVRLFFAGQETDWGAALHAGAASRLATWLGRRDDVPRLLAAADIILQPSRSEGLPLALMEAASAGCAMVASRVGGVPEVIEDGGSGLLVPPDDAAALADAIARLAADPALAEALGRSARKGFEARFSIDTMIQATLAVYQACLEGRPA